METAKDQRGLPKQNITSFILHEKQSEDTQDRGKAVKDDELMSGRLTNNLDPVIFSPERKITTVEEESRTKEKSQSNHASKQQLPRAVNRKQSSKAISSHDEQGHRASSQLAKDSIGDIKAEQEAAGQLSQQEIAQDAAGLLSTATEVQAQKQRRARKKPADFNKMNHYEIMQHIEEAALRQKLSKAREGRMSI